MVEDKTKSIYLFRAYQILQIAKDGLNVSPFAFFEHPYIDWEKIFNTLLKFK